MMAIMFLVFLGLYLFFFGSLHTLVILLFVEVIVLSVFVFLSFSCFTWFSCLLFLLVAVCLGAYGVSLLVSISRSKGTSYCLSF